MTGALTEDGKHIVSFGVGDEHPMSTNAVRKYQERLPVAGEYSHAMLDL